MIKINEKINDFELETYQNNKIKKIKISDYKEKWLILFFYPADFTYVCPTELSEMADMYDEFKKEDAEILSVSCDTIYTHKAWHDISPSIQKIKFPMASDHSGKLAREFNIYIEDEGLSLRGTFIISPERILKSIEINNNDIGRKAEETLRKLRAAKFVSKNKGMVCPASWEPDQKTLKKDLDLVGKI